MRVGSRIPEFDGLHTVEAGNSKLSEPRNDFDPLYLSKGDAGRVGPDAGPVQAAVRGQAEREAAVAAGPHHPRGAQRRPHRPGLPFSFVALFSSYKT